MSNGFFHAFQQKCTLFRYCQVSLLCDIYQATRFTNYFPNFEKVGDILVSACPCVCLYGGSRYPLDTSCMDSSWKNSRRTVLVFPELSVLVKLRPFEKQGDEIL